MRARHRDEKRGADIRTSAPRASAVSTAIARVLVATALISVCVPTPVLANKPDAVRQFASAQKLYEKGDYAAALPLFQAVLEDSGSPNARLYVARCLRELGRLPEAFDEMDATQRDAATRAETEPKYARTRDASAAERAILETRIGRLIVAIADPPEDVRVTVNDEPFSNDRLGTPTTVAPGTIKVTVEASGSTTIQRSISISPGETKTVALTLDPLEVESAPTSQPSPVESQPSRGGVRTVGFVITGLGVAGMALAGVTWVIGDSQNRTYHEECPGVPRDSNERCDQLVSTGQTLDILTNVGLIGGIAGIAVGTAMVVFGGPSGTPPATAKVSISPSRATLDLTVAF